MEGIKAMADERRAQLQNMNAALGVLEAEVESMSQGILRKQESLQNDVRDTEHRLNEMVDRIQMETRKNSDMMAQLKCKHERVEQLRHARNIVHTVLQAQDLSNNVSVLIDKLPQSAMESFSQLTELASSAESLFPAESPTLDYLQELAHQARIHIEDVLKSKLVKAVEALEWPNVVTAPYSFVMEQRVRKFRRCFQDYLSIATIQYEMGRPELDTAPLAVTCRAVSALFTPLCIRFKYHFMGHRPTNRLDKPEWYFTWILDAIRDHAAFLDDECQWVLATSFKDIVPPIQFTAKQIFIHGLVEAVQEKLKLDTEQIMADIPVLSRTITEALSFDADLLNTHGYHPLDEGQDWIGTVGVLIGERAKFQHWLRAEKEFAMQRFEEIILADDAWKAVEQQESVASQGRKAILLSETASVNSFRTGLSMDGSESDSLSLRASGLRIEEDADRPHPTHSAEALVALLEVITERFRPLPTLAFRVRFFLDVQLPVIEKYHQEIQERVEAFDSARNSLLGVSVEMREKTTGMKGLDLLCRWFGSAKWMKTVLNEWSDDVFFLEMWDDVSRIGNHARSNSSGSHKSVHVPSATHSFDEQLTGTIFDDVIHSYSSVQDQIMNLMTRYVVKELTSSLGPYLKRKAWALQESNLEEAISPELSTPLFEFTRSLSHLAQNMPRKDFGSLFANIARGIDEWLWTRLVLVRDFGQAGARQLSFDFHQGFGASVKAWVRHPERQFPRIRDVCILLYDLPFSTDQSKEATWTKHALERELHGPNASVLLEELGIYKLSPKEAADVVARRM